MTRSLSINLTLVVVVASLFLIGSVLAAQDAQPTARTADREQITALVRSWEEAWNSHDMRALANLFHEDGIWILWTGQVWTGRKTIEEGHAAVHRTVFRNSIQRERLEELTFVGPDAAVVRFYSTLTGDERSPNEVVRSRKILMVSRREGMWRVGWGQNTHLAASTPD